MLIIKNKNARKYCHILNQINAKTKVMILKWLRVEERDDEAMRRQLLVSSSHQIKQFFQFANKKKYLSRELNTESVTTVNKINQTAKQKKYKFFSIISHS